MAEDSFIVKECIYIWKKIIFFVCLFLLVFQIIVLASPPWGYPTTNFEITSPFGYRKHPISGEWKGHTGVDLATPFGTDVVSVDEGVVTFVGFDEKGYGNYLIINHGDGLETLYAHNYNIVVFEGTRVSKGTVIAHCGSTGGSTGPHVHFEVRLNGLRTDPAPYLDPSIPMPKSSKLDMLPDGTIVFFSSDNAEIEWDENYYVNFGDRAKKVTDDIVAACDSGMAKLLGPVRNLFLILITIDLALSAMFNLSGEQEDVVIWLCKRFLRYGFLLWIITDWKTVFVAPVLQYFATMGGLAGSAVGGDVVVDMTTAYATAGQLLSDSTVMMQKGAYLAGPAFAHASTIYGPAVVLSFADLFFSLCFGFGILACFILMGLEMLLVYSEFYIISTLSLVMFSFMGLKQTEEYGENSWKGVITVGIKVMLFSFFTMIMNALAQGTPQVAYDPVVYLRILIGCITVLIMSIRLSKVVGKLLS